MVDKKITSETAWGIMWPLLCLAVISPERRQAKGDIGLTAPTPDRYSKSNIHLELHLKKDKKSVKFTELCVNMLLAANPTDRRGCRPLNKLH